MLTPNRIYVIFIVFMVMCCVSQSFKLDTKENLIAVRGRSISLPCKFDIHARAVYWYKHNSPGAPVDGSSLVAYDNTLKGGFTDPVSGFERFSIAKDCSLIISNVTVHDEATYSCKVVNSPTVMERGYTNSRVIALAEPLEPIVESCNVTAPGRCIYTVDENSPEDVTLVCMVHNVRPPPDLTWIRSDRRIQENATHRTQEKDGLFNVSSQIQISKSHLGHQYTCQAKGEAMNGTSFVIINTEDYVTTVSHDRRINGGFTTSIVFNVVLLILLVSCLVYMISRFRGPSKGNERNNSRERVNFI